MKVQGNFISFPKSGEVNDTLPQLLDNFKANKGSFNSIAFKDIPERSTVILGKYKGNSIKWTVTLLGEVFGGMFVDKTAKTLRIYDKHLISKRYFDLSSIPVARAGEITVLNQYEDSYLGKWLNSDDKTAKYYNENGFLSEWTPEEKNVFDTQQKLVVNFDVYLPNKAPKNAKMGFDTQTPREEQDLFWSSVDSSELSSQRSYVYGNYQNIAQVGLLWEENLGVEPIICIKDSTPFVFNGTDYVLESAAETQPIVISADKMQESRAADLAGAVWVYGDHMPNNVNDGTKINLTREEVVKPDVQSYSNPKTVGDLPSNSKVKLGRYGGKELQWLVCRNAEKKLFLVLEKDSVIALHGKIYDAPEPNNPDSNRKDYGNNNYPLSNIHQWLNSNKGHHEWYSKSHVYDAPPSYQSEKGFLKDWLPEELLILPDTQWTTTKADVDGGGTENFTSKIALMSTTEVGFETGTGGSKLDIFNSDEDRNIGEFYWTRNPYLLFPHGAGCVFDDGSVDFAPISTAYYVRPICSVSETLSISDNPDSDGCYTFLAILPLERTVTWNKAKNFFARQFTFNPKKQYQTMLEGAIYEIKGGTNV